MAKVLSDATGIVIDADFLDGKIEDGTTLVGEHINQDIIQFFQKLMSNAGLTANGDFDNETNGYQFIEALQKFNKYYAENYDSGEIDPSTVTAGELWLGKGAGVKIKNSGVIEASGDINTDGGFNAVGDVAAEDIRATDSMQAGGNITSTTGNIEATVGQFIGVNAPKMLTQLYITSSISITNLGEKELVTVTESSGEYTCTLPETVSGVIIFNANVAVLSSGGVLEPCMVTVIKSATTQFRIKVWNDDGTIPTPSSTTPIYIQFAAYWE